MRKRRSRKSISIVIPAHNESKNIEPLIGEIVKNIPPLYSYDIIIVDDGSVDNTWSVIQKLAKKNKNLKGIKLYKNSGQQAALYLGITTSSGDAVITMDSDFQHPPELLPKLITHWERGHDLVLPVTKESKSRSKLTNIARRLAYKIWQIISQDTLIPGVSEFRLIDKRIVNYLKACHEGELYIRGILTLAAKNPVLVPYKINKRKFGQSSYTFKKLIGFFMGGFVSFSVWPLRVASVFGAVAVLSAGMFLFFDIVSAFIIGKRILEGWLTLVLLILILNGFVIIYLGIIGEYLGIIFKEIKRRPRYFIGETVNL